MMKFRFTGHDAFTCRYAWLPKAVECILEDPQIFSHEDDAMIKMGVGKNMVKSIRFWVEVMGVAEKAEKGMKLTEFGQMIFGQKYDGLDPFLEDIKTLWLLHWKLNSIKENPLFANHYILNHWHKSEIVPSSLLREFQYEIEMMGKTVSLKTLQTHLSVFLHTYVPTKGKKGIVQEDSLDCPLVELGFIENIGESFSINENSEDVYVFNRNNKPEITTELFLYTLVDFANRFHKNEQTISFKEVAIGDSSPGQVFKLTEMHIREYLEEIAEKSKQRVAFKEAANVQQILFTEKINTSELLDLIYKF